MFFFCDSIFHLNNLYKQYLIKLNYVILQWKPQKQCCMLAPCNLRHNKKYFLTNTTFHKSWIVYIANRSKVYVTLFPDSSI